MSHALLEPVAERGSQQGRFDGRPVGVADPLWRVAVVGLTAGALSRIDGLPPVPRLLLLLVFVGLAPGGAALVWWRGLSPFARAGLTPVLGVSVVVLLTALEAFTKTWNPSLLQLVLVGVSALSLAVAAALGRPTVLPVHLDTEVDTAPTASTGGLDSAPTAPTQGLDSAPTAPPEGLESGAGIWCWSAARLPVAVLAVALMAWALCLPNVGRAPVSAWGLLVAASPALPIALALVVVAALLAFRFRSATGLVAAAVVMVLVQRLTVTLATQVPLYAWTYKHIAVVDYIDRFHYVVRGTDIYHNWPGMFTLTAWLDELSGVSSLDIAHWFTPVLHLVTIPLIYVAARAWRRSPLVSAATVFIFEACSFIAQDYFSPQALAYLLGIGVVLGLGEAAYRRAASLPVLVVFAAIVVSHQLTPYWLILVAAGLVVLRRVKPWWLPLMFAAMAGSYYYLNLAIVTDYGPVASTDPLANIRLTARATPLLGFRVAFLGTVTAYAIAFGIVGVVLGVRLLSRRHRRSVRREWRAPAALAFGPVLLLAVQGYGGEAVFRVFLYALPGLAPVLATVFLRVAGARTRVAAPMAALTVLLVFAAAQSYLGVFSAYRIDRSQLQAWTVFNRDAASNAFFFALGPGYPSNWQENYVSHITVNPYYARSFFSGNDRVKANFATDAQYESFMSLFESAISSNPADVYLTTSDANQNYSQINGNLPAEANQNLKRHMLSDPRWVLVEDFGDSAIFRFIRS